MHISDETLDRVGSEGYAVVEGFLDADEGVASLNHRHASPTRLMRRLAPTTTPSPLRAPTFSIV